MSKTTNGKTGVKSVRTPTPPTMTSFKVDTWEDYDNEEALVNLGRKLGYINAKHAIEIFREAGQNPTAHVEQCVVKETEGSGTGMLMLEDMFSIFGRYWKNRETMEMELERAVQAFTLNKDESKNDGEEPVLDVMELFNFLLNHGQCLSREEAKAFQRELIKVKSSSSAMYALAMAYAAQTANGEKEAPAAKTTGKKKKKTKTKNGGVKKAENADLDIEDNNLTITEFMKYFHENDFKKIEAAELAALPDKKSNESVKTKLKKSAQKVALLSSFKKK